ncbi:MAG: holo-ACP synthase [Candidatus Krumholzibacteriales bacterium]
MISGIGTDITSISRIEGLIERYGGRFLERVFSGEEIEKGRKLRRPAAFFAGRFAAREAFLKALGAGIGSGIPLKELSVLNNNSGKPVFNLSPRVQNILSNRNILNVHLSITHEGGLAQAVVVTEGE